MPEVRFPFFILVAGEASGDLLGADLIAGLKARFPDARFAGIGGARMREAGMEIWHPMERLSVMGLVEVLKHLPSLLALRRAVFRRTLQEKPDVFIGIDAPDFNLGLEKKLKRAGLRTVHYVSPSIWAWRENRAGKIGRSADRVLCLFPMEPPIYARHGVDARFVGHPLANAFAPHPDKAAARRALDLPDDAPVLAVLPGSRLGEIARLGRDFLDAAVLLRREFPHLRVVLPAANAACADAVRALARDSRAQARDDSAWLHILSPHAAEPLRSDAADESETTNRESHRCMIAADAILLASGTAALEAMLAKRPMVVAYRIAPTTYRIVKAFGMLKTTVYSLPNILAGRRIVPELMQDDCTPPALAATLAPMLQARALPPDTLAEFVRIHESLRGDAGHGAAAAIAQMLDRS
ncbi:MAG: lipid-A-disaccharide synthase [Proteobacteria bacterium]|uniref:lipid-A-disaccharide synthase n=1 Tax=Rudaea sp. TaxID=2136325 RepID=UPI0032202DCD|nr:lipid-A-disaccharide synthase [Pseudomonadota bacterium]